MRRAVMRLGERLTPGMVAASLSASAALFGTAWLIRKGNETPDQPPIAAPFDGGEKDPKLEPPDEAADGHEGDGAQVKKEVREDRPEGDKDEHCDVVFRAVHDSFDELVMEGDAADKDVFVFLHQDGCPACGALTPRVRMVARMLAGEEGLPSMRVAALNGSRNNPLPPAVESRAFPRLILFPAGRKAEPQMIHMLDAKGGRPGLPTVRDILEFLEGTSGVGFRASPALLARADALEEEAKAMDAIGFRATHLVGLAYSFGSVLEDMSKPASDDAAADEATTSEAATAEDAAFATALGRFADRADLISEGVHSLADEGQSEMLDRIVAAGERHLSKLVQRVPLRSRGDGKPSAGIVLGRMLTVYSRMAEAWEDAAGERSMAMAERAMMRAGAAQAALVVRMEDDRAERS